MKYHFLRLAISWARNWLTRSILLFKCGLSCRCGIFPMMTNFPSRFLATLSMICDNSFLHCSRGWCSMLFVPAAKTVTSLGGMWWIFAFIWRAVCPGYTNPVASKEPPCTSGATPRTIELPMTVTLVAGCGVSDLALGSAGAGAGATGSSATLASAAYRLLVGMFGADMSATRGWLIRCAELHSWSRTGRGLSCMVSLIVSINFLRSPLFLSSMFTFCFSLPFSAFKFRISSLRASSLVHPAVRMYSISVNYWKLGMCFLSIKCQREMNGNAHVSCFVQIFPLKSRFQNSLAKSSWILRPFPHASSLRGSKSRHVSCDRTGSRRYLKPLMIMQHNMQQPIYSLT